MRPSGRKFDEIRRVSIETGVSMHAAGSCIIKFGNTHVLCTASIDENVPRFLKGRGKGWVTAEYGMLPGSTGNRMQREAASGKQGGRTVEIQRLIGRSLRAVVDMKAMGERQIVVDCDVLQADGGTRTASITGGFVALHLAFDNLVNRNILRQNPIITPVAAISCGIYKGNAVADLDYAEDSNAEVDANFILTGGHNIVEIQGTAEANPFTEEEFLKMLALAKGAVSQLIDIQKEALENA